MKILLVAGARPNFMKIAPLIHELKNIKKEVSYKVVHTGQHYDYEMSKTFFVDFDLPDPDYFLEAGSGSHAIQTAMIMVAFEKVCIDWRPDLVVVVGDVNSTLACSITAKKLNIKVAHVEAGLRSGDMTMPEEINRIVTDSISDYLFVTEKSGFENLQREGKDKNKIYFVGNIMIDTLFINLKKINSEGRDISSKEWFRSGEKPYVVVTLHRPSNVDHQDVLEGILASLQEISHDRAIYFPIHPRTQKSIDTFHLNRLLEDENIYLLPPLSYHDFLALWKDASLVLTDSGGIQEETTVLGVPCFTIRENTERPITIEEGTNVLVGKTQEGIMKAYRDFQSNGIRKGKRPEFWDGQTAKRIIEVILTRARRRLEGTID